MGLLKSKGRVETAKDRVRPLAESASEKIGPVAGQVRDHLGPAVGTAREKVSPYAEKAVERGAHLAHVAVEKASPVIDDALAKVGPATEHAAEKARERFNDDVLPKVTAALASLAAAAEPVVEETSRRGRATKAALKGELDVPQKKSHRLRKIVLLLGFGALAAAAVKKLLTPPEPAWQSTPTSGRDYSSAPAGTTSRPSETKPEAKSETQAETKSETGSETKAEPASSNGQTETAESNSAGATDAAPGGGVQAEAADTDVNATANGAAKKSTTPRKTSNPKPSDS
ncbi:hypothetical protein [Kribbella swartbergensis]